MVDPPAKSPAPSSALGPRCTYLILCDSHAMQGGKHIFYGVFDRLFAPRFPAFHAKLVLAGELLGAGDTEVEFTVVFQDSDDIDIVPPLGPIKMRLSAFGTGTFQLNVEGLPLTKRGMFTFKVVVGGGSIGERTLYVDNLEHFKP